MQVGIAPADQFRIMLVDDDDAVREAVSEILARKGWKVAEFRSAESAIADLKVNDYDIVLADINMPGMSGIDLLHKAKEAAPHVPVVMITGYPSIDLAVEAMKDGAVDFLPKPFKAEELEICVRRAADGAKVIRAEMRARGGKLSGAVGSMPEAARKRLEDKIKELSVLHTISETLDESNDRDAIYRKVMDLGQIIADADSAFVLTAEAGGKDFVARAATGFRDSAIIGRRFTPGMEPFRSVLRTRGYSYLMIDNDELIPLVSDGMGTGKRRPLLLAPMIINKEVLAIVGLNCKDSAGEITADTVALLNNLAAKASLKLENIALSENILSSIIGALNSLINALDARDTYTKDHSNRVTQYALKIAKSFKSPQVVLDSISYAGPLHDIGKIGVRDEILLKKSGFSIDEREIMKSHVLRGEEILRPLNLMAAEKAVVLYHHERWDGKGYPYGLAGLDIPEAARIFCVADTYDAMTSTRPYRTALTPEMAREEIARCRGTQFDPAIVDAFIESEIVKGREP
ncbi:MAG: response regulator [Deltaproteobacteria bacterium]|nr:response regulator [Deltaproteobacteria bacterium]